MDTTDSLEQTKTYKHGAKYRPLQDRRRNVSFRRMRIFCTATILTPNAGTAYSYQSSTNPLVFQRHCNQFFFPSTQSNLWNKGQASSSSDLTMFLAEKLLAGQPTFRKSPRAASRRSCSLLSDPPPNGAMSFVAEGVADKPSSCCVRCGCPR